MKNKQKFKASGVRWSDDTYHSVQLAEEVTGYISQENANGTLALILNSVNEAIGDKLLGTVIYCKKVVFVMDNGQEQSVFP